MPDPATLQVGDRVRFVSLPEEWERPGFTVHPESVEFMEAMIGRRFPSRVYKIDEYGQPWIRARVRGEEGLEWHSWAIMEETGWRRVEQRE